MVVERISQLEDSIERGKKLRMKAIATLDDPCNLEVISLKLEDFMEKIIYILKIVADPNSNITIDLI